MTPTDDFLADLEVQLRDARPRRDVGPALAAAAVVILAIAVLALSPRGREGTPAAQDGPSVAIVNASGDPALASRARAWLTQRGYAVVSTMRAPRQDETTVTAPASRFAGQARRLAVAMQNAGGSASGSWTGYAPLEPRAQLVLVLGQNQLSTKGVTDVRGANDVYPRMMGWLRSHGIEATAGGTGETPARTTLRVGYLERPYVPAIARVMPVRPDIVYTKDWFGLQIEVGRNDPLASPDAEPGPGLTAQIVSPVHDRRLEDELVVALQNKGYMVPATIYREPLTHQDPTVIIGTGADGEEAADALLKSLRGVLKDPHGTEEGNLLPRTSFPGADVLIWLGERDLTPPEVVDIVDESGGRSPAAGRRLRAEGIEVGSVQGGHGRVRARTEILWARGRERFARRVAQTLGVDARLFPTVGLRTIVHLGTDLRF